MRHAQAYDVGDVWNVANNGKGHHDGACYHDERLGKDVWDTT